MCDFLKIKWSILTITRELNKTVEKHRLCYYNVLNPWGSYFSLKVGSDAQMQSKDNLCPHFFSRGKKNESFISHLTAWLLPKVAFKELHKCTLSSVTESFNYLPKGE